MTPTETLYTTDIEEFFWGTIWSRSIPDYFTLVACDFFDEQSEIEDRDILTCTDIKKYISRCVLFWCRRKRLHQVDTGSCHII
jgi:hypothetical protein